MQYQNSISMRWNLQQLDDAGERGQVLAGQLAKEFSPVD
jgi:hypothetical protein